MRSDPLVCNVDVSFLLHFGKNNASLQVGFGFVFVLSRQYLQTEKKKEVTSLTVWLVTAHHVPCIEMCTDWLKLDCCDWLR